MSIIVRMKKLVGLMIVGLLWCATMMAGEVTEQQALQKAQRFLQSKQFVSGKSLRRASQQGVESPAFYIFNAENNGGFVIVSADDRTEEILGYSEQGAIDVDHMPDNLRAWLDGYTQEIKSLPTTAKATRRASAVREEIPVLVKSQWGQDEPFNWRTPTYTNDKGETVHYVTGCVATAMAQMMYYHKWPVTSPAISGYTTRSLKIDLPELPATTFQWDKMLDSYSSDYSEEAGNAVADLFIYCGQSVMMDYNEGGSGASTYHAAARLNDTFGYSAAIKEVYRSSFTTVEWEDIIYGELSAQRPIMYSGDSSSGGHAFICDGYKDGMYHFNFGWGGYTDSYYVISAYSDLEYNFNQSAVIGIEPDKGQTVTPSLTVWMQCEKQQFSRSSESEDFVVDFDAWFYNNQSDFTGQWALALYHNGSLEKILNTWSGTIKAGDMPWHHLETIGSIANGTYTIRGLYRCDDTSEWQLCSGSDYSVMVDGLTMTVFNEGIMNLSVNSCEFLGKKKIGRTCTLKLNITNNGTSKSQVLALYLNDVEYVKLGINVDPGTTADVPISFIPETAGEISLKVVCTDNATDPLWQGTVTIEEKVVRAYSLKADVSGMKLKDGTLTIHLPVTNQEAYEYDDNISVWLYRYDPSNGYYWSFFFESFEKTIAANGTETVIVSCDHVVDGDDLLLIASYTSNDEGVEALTKFFMPKTTVDGDANGDGIVSIADVTGIVNYMLGNSSDGFNTAVGDINGDGKITISDATGVVNLIFKSEPAPASASTSEAPEP